MEIKLCQGIQDQSTQAMDRHTTLGPLQILKDSPMIHFFLWSIERLAIEGTVGSCHRITTTTLRKRYQKTRNDKLMKEKMIPENKR